MPHSIGPGLDSEQDELHFCECTKSDRADGLYDLPRTLDLMYDIALDRRSFRDRGWEESDLGLYPDQKRGLSASLFYAIENKTPGGEPHPWDEPCHDWDRGLGAHVDHWLWAKSKKHYKICAYTIPNPPKPRGVIVGRRSNEHPFAGLPASACGYYKQMTDEIYLKTDYSWRLGERIDAPVCFQENGKIWWNITYVIAHEMGHFLGFAYYLGSEHVLHPESMMTATFTNKPGPRPQWQLPEQQWVALIKRLVGYLD